ncbi:MAG TPA: FKBP-type peptidyl-prolyl cis-trans isomerase [Burkholderiales bacterium]|nr:FKBP-type peptidyl-prolyl cis-trans isomerase [Burkholderiales bacterium]
MSRRIITRLFAAVIALCTVQIVCAQNISADAPTQLEVIDRVIGTGKTIARGAFVVLQYSGYLFDPAAPDHKGYRFVSSRERGESLSYKYGLKRAIPGFEKGLQGMKVGGSRTIVVPAQLGYDDLKYPRPQDVPPKSALVFDVELIDVVPESAPPDN